MTHSAQNDSLPEPQGADVGPDPVVGAGLTLFGILVMGISGARDAHYPFDVGVLIAVVGAGVFVASVALSALKQRALEEATATAAAAPRDEAPASSPPPAKVDAPHARDDGGSAPNGDAA